MDGTKQKPLKSLIKASDRNLLTKEDTISMRWKEYCEELYNYKIQKDLQVLNEPVHKTDRDDEEILLVVEVEQAIRELKKGKAPDTDNNKSEQIQYGGEVTATVLHNTEDQTMANFMDRECVYNNSKEGTQSKAFRSQDD